jgi:hypothetical protein
MPVLVDLARSGVRMLFDTARGIRVSPECVKALIHADDDPPVKPKSPPEPKDSEPVEPPKEWEPPPVDPANAIEQKIRNLERTGLWDPGR